MLFKHTPRPTRLQPYLLVPTLALGCIEGSHSHLALGAKLDFAKRTLPAHRKTTPFANVDRAVLLARAAPLLTALENTMAPGHEMHPKTEVSPPHSGTLFFLSGFFDFLEGRL